jgi:hypothetical protein
MSRGIGRRGRVEDQDAGILFPIERGCRSRRGTASVPRLVMAPNLGRLGEIEIGGKKAKLSLAIKAKAPPVLR